MSVGGLYLVLCGGADAQQQQTFYFDLPQQPLSASLKEYARVSGQQIIFTEDLVLGYRGHPIQGRLSADQALRELLAGTDLFVEHTATGAVMIRRATANAPTPIQARAPDFGNDTTEEVIVTGLIHSLQTNLDIKRAAGGLVDVISSEDIGKFPDVDLAAAMQRIPGVTISRGVSSLGGVPTSIGTATQITVRGFGPAFNETLFANRQVASGVGRAFDFSAIGADFVSRIDVMKTPDATLSSGAIGATVNIRFPEPLDHPGFNMVGSASTTTSPEQGAFTPTVKALISDTFDHDRFGILLDGAYAVSRTRGNHVNIQGWEGTRISQSQLKGALPGASTIEDTNAWYIQDYGIYQETTTDTRINGRAVLQWRPDADLLVTLDGNYARDTLHARQYGFSVWFNSGSLRDITQNANGTISSFIQPNSPTDFQSQINGSVLQNNDAGLNVRWNASDRLTVNLDYDYSQAWLNPDGQISSLDADVGYGPSTPGGIHGTNVGIVLPGGHNLPYPTGYGPGGDASRFLDPTLMGSHVLPLTSQQRFDRVQQARTELVWHENDNLTLTAGYQYVGDHDNAHAMNDFVNNQWQAYAGYGPASNNTGSHGVALPPSLFGGSFSTAGFIDGFGGSANLPPRVVAYDAHSVLNYLQGLGNPQTTAIAGFNTGCCSPPFDGTYRLDNVPESYSQVVENTDALYLSMSLKTSLAGMPLNIHAGLRGEYTSVTTIGLGQSPVTLAVQPSDHTAYLVNFGATSMVTGHNSYQSLLPNLDLTLEPRDDVQVRFDVSRTLTRPPLNQITPVLTVPTILRVGALTASGGNPDLMPYVSVNIDLSTAWYYQRNSYVSVDLFNKNVSDFIVQGSTQETINNVIDPNTGLPALFTVSTNVNGPAANIYGAEFAVQHVFGESGFGFQANATLVGTNKPYNPQNLAVSGFAVTGLANSANLVAFYDRNGFQARIAANWRDEYLDHFGQQQGNSRFGTEPTFVNASTQIDFSTSYDITPSLYVYFSAQNLNDATFSTHGRFSEQLLDMVDYGRRFTLGVHFKY
ncbi:MAG: TonB-dependent receptor [Alphaproteobacteria bacterium]|nr:TonB-dependent receptor [Alphaproteobacteria bacterium]